MLIDEYLQNKKVYSFRGKSYYKLKNYTTKYYVLKEKVESLNTGVKEVLLEINYKDTPIKGRIKWNAPRNKISVSEGTIRSMFKIFDIE